MTIDRGESAVGVKTSIGELDNDLGQQLRNWYEAGFIRGETLDTNQAALILAAANALARPLPPLGNLRKLLEAYTLRLATDRGYNASRGIIVDELERILDADETKLCICRGFPRHPGECPQCSAASQPPEQAPYCTCPASYPQHMGHHPDCTSQRVESTKIGEPK
jgi:hypothetical protein